jgi:hypothetical protein
MKTKLFLSLIASITLTSCGYNYQEAKEHNDSSFSNPEFVGMVEGQSLYRIEVARVGVEANHNHFVYFFKSKTNSVVTVNHEVPIPKSTMNVVEVFLNGMKVSSNNVPSKLEE